MPIPDIERAEDDTLVQAVQRGDPDAFEPLIDRYLTHLRAFIALKAPVPHLVDELAHEPALKNYHLLGSVRGDLLCKLGRYAEARAAFEAAAALAGNKREQQLLKRRAAEAIGRAPDQA